MRSNHEAGSFRTELCKVCLVSKICELIYGSKFVYNTAKASGNPDIQIQMQVHAEVYLIIECDFHSKLDPQNGHS
jgi:hypothetical protein